MNFDAPLGGRKEFEVYTISYTSEALVKGTTSHLFSLIVGFEP